MMKYKLQFFITFLIIIISFELLYAQAIPVDSLYLGQIPPGNKPKIFIPHSHARLAISNDGKTIYYSAVEGQYYENTRYFKYFNNKWNGPFKLFDGYMAPTFSKDGDTLYTQKYTYQSYFSLKQDSIWSTPSLISKDTLYYLQETNLGNYYCGSEKSGGIGGWDIYKVVINNAVIIYQNLGRPLNTTNNDVEFFISKDESFIVLGANEGGPGGRDLYISYRKSDNSWTSPKSLGTLINDGPYYKWGPYVTPDNKYLFYAREPNPYNIYWVRFDKLLDSLRYTNFPPYAKCNIPPQKAEKGVLFNFTVPDSIFYDEDHDSLTYSATLDNGNPLPGWLSFNPVTRTFSGTPLTLTNAFRPLSIEVLASDPSHESGSCVFSLAVVNPTGIEENKDQLPKKSQLRQNYPNPFNPSTIISWQLASSGHVILKVYDILGREIATLVNKNLDAGSYRINWNVSKIESGIYFYQLKSGNFVSTKKMQLLK